ncbi:sulfate adenylyltransferase small subunit, partial [Streptomyces xanthophaeus]
MTTTVAHVHDAANNSSGSAPYALSHLDALESEAVHIFREVAGEFEKPVILFSGGKDS